MPVLGTKLPITHAVDLVIRVHYILSCIHLQAMIYDIGFILIEEYAFALTVLLTVYFISAILT